MKSWITKGSAVVVLTGGCWGLNSCALFGGGKYSSQMEVETEVPDSLEHGKPSQGPAATQSSAYASTTGVPPTSNLIDVPEVQTPSPTHGTPGGPSIVGLPADSPRDLIDIPKPDFNAASSQSDRSPAAMLSLGPPLQKSPRMSFLDSDPTISPYAAKAVKQTVEPLGSPVYNEADLASAPKALKGESTEPGVPLLHGPARLSDFYMGLHQPLLDTPVVENQVATTPEVSVTADAALSVPPPPPPAEDLVKPEPQ